MENKDKGFPDIVDIVRSWIPRRTEPTNVSRNFWMPDHSCRVCYECDAQFTIFNRRHHCRLCGRVFCAKCTANSVPVSVEEHKNGREEGERIRVCNFCFRQWRQQMATPTAAPDNEFRCSSPGLSPSPSLTSLASTKSSCTANSSSSVGCSVPYTNRPYQRLSYSCSQPIQLESDKQEVLTPRRDMNSVPDIGDPSPHQFGFCLDRSDDDDEYSVCRSDSEVQRFPQSDEFYGQEDFDEVENNPESHNVHADGENDDAREFTSVINENHDFPTSVGIENLEEVGSDNAYDCDASSSIYNMEGADAEPVDFENNGMLWFPPEPENAEDEKEDFVFDEEDDSDATGQFGYLRSSNSFGSGEFRNRPQSGEEHRKAMKGVVDGHFRALVSQLLLVENLPTGEEGGNDSWLEIITFLSWEVASLLKPDTSKGGGMDPGGYVKVKCIASGKRSESMVVKGVVCRKNLANRRMKSKIEKPQLLILGGALEYQRVSHLLSSFDTLLQQEMDHLKMAVAKIDAHHPNVLLVEKTVSRFAQEYLLAKDISLVLNLKRPLLERIARCTGAQIVPSIDHLSSQQLGHCDMFHVEKFFEEHDGAGSSDKKSMKTLMFFEGCPKPYGCTVLLKGANSNELKKVKHVVQYGVFAAYHLALETSFLADEGASLPELPLKSPITVALPDKPSSIGRSISTIPGFTPLTSQNPQSSVGMQSDKELHMSDTLPLPGKNESKKMATSTCSYEVYNSHNNDNSTDFTNPTADKKTALGNCFGTEIFPEIQSISVLSFPCMPRNSDSADISSNALQHKGGVDIKDYPDLYNFKANSQLNVNGLVTSGNYMTSLKRPEESYLIKSDLLSDGMLNPVKETTSCDSAIVRQFYRNQEEMAPSKEDFPPSPSDHQSILVSLSTRCVWKGTVCERAHLFRIKYYGSFDKPLGRFLRDHLFDQGYRCRSCEMPSEAHVHCYTHRQGSLTISVKKFPESLLAGERDGKIWMWHRCLRCPRKGGIPPETRRVVMSDAAWGLSFGKFLELSFSNHAAASRVASCGHSLHRDCLRFYGFGKMVACFRYASIDVHSVFLPPSQLDFNIQFQDWVQNEVHEVLGQAEVLFTEVSNAIHHISSRRKNAKSPDNNLDVPDSAHCIGELEGMLQKEKSEFEESFHRVLKKDATKGQPIVDALEINKFRRQLVFHSYLWDQRLIFATGLDNGSHEWLNGVLLRSRENINSNDKLVELNLSSKPMKVVNSLEPFSNGLKSNDVHNINACQINHQAAPQDQHAQQHIDFGSFETQQVSSFVKDSEVYQSTNSNPQQLDPIESGIVVCRSLSDGQVPLVTNLSDTLDAKWIGENASQMGCVTLSGPALSVEASSYMLQPEQHIESHGGPCESQPLTTAFPMKLGDTLVKEFSSWTAMPFALMYHSINKNSTGVALVLHDICEYSPVYISSFHELQHQGGAKLLLPVGINDTVIPVYDDEPTSIISYALMSPDYHVQMSDERERIKDGGDSSILLPICDSGSFHPFQSFDEISSETFRSMGSVDDGMLSLSGSRSSLASDPLLYTKALHVRVSFCDDGPLGKVKYTVTCYCAKRFDALRKICCPSDLDFIRSLSRCKKWGAQGGKSNVFFAKSLDDRFIIKQVTKTELESFIKFAPEYFKYLSESISTGSPTCLAKILGIYQVASKHLKGGKESKIDVLVMENLLYGRNITRLYDLKGSSRSRYNADASGANKVLLDQNLIEAMPTSPIFVGNKAKRLLERAVWNDTAFLASIDVMDYSLLVGVDEERHELVLGIIDFMRQYTWDKHLETWVKASGILGGPKNASPTVVSPKQYKKRFRKAMSAYFLMVPDQWSPPSIIPSRSQSDFGEDNTQPSSEL